jgi:hypothetical protein
MVDTTLPAPASDTALTIIEPTAIATPTDTYIASALIADLGDQAGWRYVEFFTANIRNPHTRGAYARACARFFAWCEQRDLTLAGDPAARRRHLYRAAADAGLGAVSQAATRRRTNAVRLARCRPGGPGKSGLCGPRPEACRENRQDAGARG